MVLQSEFHHDLEWRDGVNGIQTFTTRSVLVGTFDDQISKGLVMIS